MKPFFTQNTDIVCKPTLEQLANMVAQMWNTIALLQQQQPQPVPVSERLPGPEDCDAEGRCWMLSKCKPEWRLISAEDPGVPHLRYAFSHWLPAQALPLPTTTTTEEND